MRDDSSNEQRHPCPSCHAGHVNMQNVAYFTWLNGELITVPDFPAWVCDMCGLREYDERALSWLNIILSPDTGQSKKPFHHKVKPIEPTAVQPDY